VRKVSGVTDSIEGKQAIGNPRSMCSYQEIHQKALRTARGLLVSFAAS
jgi:hypothetical protein